MLPRTPGASKPALHPRERCLSPISAVNLLSREFVNRLVPELEACALLIFATFIEPRTRHACTERNTSRPRKHGLAVAGITCLEWRVGLAPISPAVAPKSPPHGMSGCPDMTRTGVFNPCTSRDSKTTDVPFRLLRETPVAQSQPRELEPFPHVMHQHHSFPSSETPSTQWILVTSPLACAWSDPPDNEQYPSFAALACRSTRVHTQSLCARHATPRLFIEA